METTKQKVRKLDKYLRDKPGMTSDKFIAEYCPVLAEHAYATHDGSLNEMEKTLTHVVGMLIYYKRFAEIMGFRSEDFDPRNVVNTYEEKQRKRDSERMEIAASMIKKVLDNQE